MKPHASDRVFFSDLSPELIKAWSSVSVCRLQHFESSKAKSSVVVEESLEPSEVVARVKENNVRHLVQKNPDRFDQDLMRAGYLIESSEHYFSKNASMIGEEIDDSLELVFSTNSDKNVLKKATLDFVESLGSQAVNEAANAIIEELYMHAVIDAPKEATKVGLPISARSCELFLAVSHERKSLQISCTDFCGSLEIGKMINRMDEVYQKGAGQVMNMQSEAGGAGIGCVILFENCSSLILGVKRGVQTKVTCLVPIGISNRKRAEIKKNLPWFQL